MEEVKVGRKPYTIDWDKVNTYLRAHCDGTSIAAFLGIHPNTLYRKCEEEHSISFSDYQAAKRAEGKDLLRAKMFEEAMTMKDGTAMRIWLSKNWLGMSNAVRVEAVEDISYSKEEAERMKESIFVTQKAKMIDFAAVEVEWEENESED